MTLWTVARQAPLSMEFSRQGYWSRLPVTSYFLAEESTKGMKSPSISATVSHVAPNLGPQPRTDDCFRVQGEERDEPKVTEQSGISARLCFLPAPPRPKAVTWADFLLTPWAAIRACTTGPSEVFIPAFSPQGSRVILALDDSHRRL